MIQCLRAIPYRSYIELTKPRILTMVLVTAALGYFLGGMGVHSFSGLMWLLLGVALTSGGAGALNHVLERDVDARMARTRNRPLPSGTISPFRALIFGEYLVLGGTAILAWQVNLLTAFLALMTAFLYALIYTPMKRISWTNTLVGAVPGALPPVGGWTAATGQLDPGAWALFALLFVWQMPHFYSIAWMFKDDYAQAGFKMLPCEDPTGRRTFAQTIGWAVLLIPVSLLPMWLHISGWPYAVGALILGLWMLASSIRFVRSGSRVDARKLLLTTVVYLPLMLGLIVVDFSLGL